MKYPQLDSLRPVARPLSIDKTGTNEQLLKEDQKISIRLSFVSMGVAIVMGISTMAGAMQCSGNLTVGKDTVEKIKK